MRYEHIEMPRYPRPKLSHNTEWDVWSPYPRQAEPVPGHLSCVSHGWSDLMMILRSFGEWTARKEKQSESDIVSKGKTLYRELQKWEADLAECLNPELDSVPQILLLQ